LRKLKNGGEEIKKEEVKEEIYIVKREESNLDWKGFKRDVKGKKEDRDEGKIKKEEGMYEESIKEEDVKNEVGVFLPQIQKSNMKKDRDSRRLEKGNRHSKRSRDGSNDQSSSPKRRKVDNQLVSRTSVVPEYKPTDDKFNRSLIGCRSVDNYDKLCKVGDGAYGFFEGRYIKLKTFLLMKLLH